MNGQQKSLFEHQGDGPQGVFDILREHAQRTPAPAAFESDTSNEAAAKVTTSGKHASIQARVLAVLKHHNNGMGMTDEELGLKITDCRYSSVVSARNSLCKRKWMTYREPALVEDSGNRRLSPTSGMRVVIWRAVGERTVCHKCAGTGLTHPQHADESPGCEHCNGEGETP